MTKDELDELVNDLLSGYIYDVLSPKLLKEVEKVVDFETLEKHLVAEILTITGDRLVESRNEAAELVGA